MTVLIKDLHKGDYFKLEPNSPYVFIRKRKRLFSSKYNCPAVKPSFALFGLKRNFKFHGNVKVYRCSSKGVIFDKGVVSDE